MRDRGTLPPGRQPASRGALRRQQVTFGARGSLWYNILLSTMSRHQTETPMSQPKQSASWVVYLMTLNKQPGGMNAVCEQSEWEEMERARPGYHTLIRAGITTEAEAEKL